MSAHLDRLGVPPADRGDYLDLLAEARRLLREAICLERPGLASPPSRVCEASALLSLELDRVGAPKFSPGVGWTKVAESRDAISIEQLGHARNEVRLRRRLGC